MTLDIFNDLVVAYVFAQEYFKKFKPKDTKSASMAQSIFIAQQLIELHENKNNSNDPNDMGLDLGSEESLKIMGEYFDKLSKVRLLKEI